MALEVNGKSIETDGNGNLTDPHASPGHQFKHESIPGFGGSKNDFIHGFFLQDIPMHRPFHPKHLSHYGCVAGILKPFIDIVADEIEKCGKL